MQQKRGVPKEDTRQSKVTSSRSPTGATGNLHTKGLVLGASVLVKKNEPANISECLGEIVDVPQHPNTWYKVKMVDGSIGNYRPSILEVVKANKDVSMASSAPEPGVVVNAKEEKSNEPLPSKSTEKVEVNNKATANGKKGAAAKKATSPSGSGKGDSGLVVGAKVQIISTSNVRQRVPDLVGRFGVISNIPEYPNTWIKVSIIGEKRAIKFQPTALKPVSDEVALVDSITDLEDGSKAVAGDTVLISEGPEKGVIGVLQITPKGDHIITSSQGEISVRPDQFKLLSGSDNTSQSNKPDVGRKGTRKAKPGKSSGPSGVRESGRASKKRRTNSLSKAEDGPSNPVARGRTEKSPELMSATSDRQIRGGSRRTSNNGPSSENNTHRQERAKRRAAQQSRAKNRQTQLAHDAPSSRIARELQERQMRMVQFLIGQREKRMVNGRDRPNLMECARLIQGDPPDECDDDYAGLLIDVPRCSICKVEKEEKQDSCWNKACPMCPVYTRTAPPLHPNAIPSLDGISTQGHPYAVPDSPKRKSYIHVSEWLPEFQPFDDFSTPDDGYRYLPAPPFPSRYVAGVQRQDRAVLPSPLVRLATAAKKVWLRGVVASKVNADGSPSTNNAEDLDTTKVQGDAEAAAVANVAQGTPDGARATNPENMIGSVQGNSSVNEPPLASLEPATVLDNEVQPVDGEIDHKLPPRANEAEKNPEASESDKKAQSEDRKMEKKTQEEEELAQSGTNADVQLSSDETVKSGEQLTCNESKDDAADGENITPPLLLANVGYFERRTDAEFELSEDEEDDWMPRTRPRQGSVCSEDYMPMAVDNATSAESSSGNKDTGDGNLTQNFILPSDSLGYWWHQNRVLVPS